MTTPAPHNSGQADMHSKFILQQQEQNSSISVKCKLIQIIHRVKPAIQMKEGQIQESKFSY